MDRNVGGRDRLLRGVLAVVLTAVALDALREGNRTGGVLAAVGTLALGSPATTCFCGLNRALGLDTTRE